MTQQSASVPRTVATEKKTVTAMVRIYRAEHHGTAGPMCVSCVALERYAHARFDACPYGAAKPTCTECPIHCYRPAEREAMRVVMRSAGPQMLFRHPWLTLVHFWKARFHKVPRRRTKKP